MNDPSLNPFNVRTAADWDARLKQLKERRDPLGLEEDPDHDPERDWVGKHAMAAAGLDTAAEKALDIAKRAASLHQGGVGQGLQPTPAVGLHKTAWHHSQPVAGTNAATPVKNASERAVALRTSGPVCRTVQDGHGYAVVKHAALLQVGGHVVGPMDDEPVDGLHTSDQLQQDQETEGDELMARAATLGKMAGLLFKTAGQGASPSIAVAGYTANGQNALDQVNRAIARRQPRRPYVENDKQSAAPGLVPQPAMPTAPALPPAFAMPAAGPSTTAAKVNAMPSAASARPTIQTAPAAGAIRPAVPAARPGSAAPMQTNAKPKPLVPAGTGSSKMPAVPGGIKKAFFGPLGGGMVGAAAGRVGTKILGAMTGPSTPAAAPKPPMPPTPKPAPTPAAAMKPPAPAPAKPPMHVVQDPKLMRQGVTPTPPPTPAARPSSAGFGSLTPPAVPPISRPPITPQPGLGVPPVKMPQKTPQQPSMDEFWRFRSRMPQNMDPGFTPNFTPQQTWLEQELGMPAGSWNMDPGFTPDVPPQQSPAEKILGVPAGSLNKDPGMTPPQPAGPAAPDMLQQLKASEFNKEAWLGALARGAGKMLGGAGKAVGGAAARLEGAAVPKLLSKMAPAAPAAAAKPVAQGLESLAMRPAQAAGQAASKTLPMAADSTIAMSPAVRQQAMDAAKRNAIQLEGRRAAAQGQPWNLSGAPSPAQAAAARARTGLPPGAAPSGPGAGVRPVPGQTPPVGPGMTGTVPKQPGAMPAAGPSAAATDPLSAGLGGRAAALGRQAGKATLNTAKSLPGAVAMGAGMTAGVQGLDAAMTAADPQAPGNQGGGGGFMDSIKGTVGSWLGVDPGSVKAFQGLQGELDAAGIKVMDDNGQPLGLNDIMTQAMQSPQGQKMLVERAPEIMAQALEDPEKAGPLMEGFAGSLASLSPEAKARLAADPNAAGILSSLMGGGEGMMGGLAGGAQQLWTMFQQLDPTLQLLIGGGLIAGLTGLLSGSGMLTAGGLGALAAGGLGAYYGDEIGAMFGGGEQQQPQQPLGPRSMAPMPSLVPQQLFGQGGPRGLINPALKMQGLDPNTGMPQGS
jgi:hypothetical protein